MAFAESLERRLTSGLEALGLALDDERHSWLMRTHSALHLLGGVVFRDLGALVTGGNMEPGMARMDFNLTEVPAGLKETLTEVEQAVAGYVFGDSTCGQRAVYDVGLTGIPVYNVNNNCSTGSTALMSARQLVEGGLDALDDTAPHPGSVWNRLPDDTRADIIEFALEHEDLTPRELAVKYTDEKQYFVSESSVYRILKAEDLITAPAHIVIKAANEFKDQTTRPNELWQTDFTYLKVLGWGWFYLSTILDDYSRYIIAWKLCTTMKAEDVTATLDLALKASGCDCATVVAKPRLLSDNGSSYIASDLADYLEDKGMDHVRGAPYHPQTQGKIERWHQTMKNRVLLEHYFLPGDLERQVGAFVEYYNTRRYHESLGNLTPADVYYGRGDQILQQREEIKRKTMLARRLRHETENA